jgi:hypothetical protein
VEDESSEEVEGRKRRVRFRLVLKEC